MAAKKKATRTVLKTPKNWKGPKKVAVNKKRDVSQNGENSKVVKPRIRRVNILSIRVCRMPSIFLKVDPLINELFEEEEDPEDELDEKALEYLILVLRNGK